jgi:hypothetical protein
MKFKDVLLLVLKNFFALVFLLIIAGRLIFPKAIEEAVINPARRMPVFGQILGTSWDKAGEVGPVLGQKTSQLADKIESSDLPVNQSIKDFFNSGEASKSASKIIDDVISKNSQSLKDLPQEAVDKIKEDVRKEMYKQICTDWLEKNK